MTKIVFITGSMRKNSFNRQLANEIAGMIGSRADVSFLDYGDIPWMNQDIGFPAPSSISRVRSILQEADGIWICSPEYNGTIPGVLKNLLDWVSRSLDPNDPAGLSAVAGKKVTISGAGGRAKTGSVRSHLADLLTFMRMEVIGKDGTGIAVGAVGWKTDVLSLDKEQKAELNAQVDTFLKVISEK